jgi:hypothetical protein
MPTLKFQIMRGNASLVDGERAFMAAAICELKPVEARTF